MSKVEAIKAVEVSAEAKDLANVLVGDPRLNSLGKWITEDAIKYHPELAGKILHLRFDHESEEFFVLDDKFTRSNLYSLDKLAERSRVPVLSKTIAFRILLTEVIGRNAGAPVVRAVNRLALEILESQGGPDGTRMKAAA